LGRKVHLGSDDSNGRGHRSLRDPSMALHTDRASSAALAQTAVKDEVGRDPLIHGAIVNKPLVIVTECGIARSSLSLADVVGRFGTWRS